MDARFFRHGGPARIALDRLYSEEITVAKCIELLQEADAAACAAKAGGAPLCEQMQALQARAAKLRPIALQDANLDAGNPHTRLFLLAEYWQQQATKARAELRNIAS